MSVPPLSRVVRFLLIAAGLIIVLSVLWSFVNSGYTNFLGGVAKSVTPKGVTVQQNQGTISFLHSVKYMGGSLQVTDWIDASAISFGIILTISLVAATPGLTLKRRFLFTAIAAAGTFVLQILAVVVMAKTFNNVFFVVVSDLFPPLLWALFSLRYWFSKQLVSQPQRVKARPATRRKGRK